MTIRAPCPASFSAAIRPMPDVAPVMTTTLSRMGPSLDTAETAPYLQKRSRTPL
jgi:hypothetical protein